VSVLADWQEQYYIQQTSDINERPRWRDSDTGIRNGKFVLYLTNRPHLPVVPVPKETMLSFGRSDRRTDEYDQFATNVPSFTLEGPANAYNLSLFLWLLFQNGASETYDSNNQVNISTFIPYTSADVNTYCSILRKMVDSTTTINQDTESHLMLGCVCKSLTLNSTEREVLTYTAEMVGASHRKYNTLGKLENVYNYPRLNWSPVSATDTLTVKHNGTAYTLVTKVSSDGFTDPSELSASECEVAVANFTNSATGESIRIGDFNFPDEHVGEEMTVSIEGESDTWSSLSLSSESWLRWQDATIKIGTDSNNLNIINLSGFNLTIANNIVPQFYDSGDVHKFSLGRLEVDGSISIPYSSVEGGSLPLDYFKTQETVYMQIYWGSLDADTDNSLSIDMAVRYIDVSYDTGIEIAGKVSFINTYTGNKNLTIKCGYNANNLSRT